MKKYNLLLKIWFILNEIYYVDYFYYYLIRFIK